MVWCRELVTDNARTKQYKVKNEWSYTSAPAICLHGMHRATLPFLRAFVKLRKATVISVVSVLPSAWNNSAPTGRIFIKFGI